jgi:hypothetical protein
MGLLLDVLNLAQGADDLETTLRVVLTSVTSGYSIGFNRAFLFLLSEDGMTLRGALAVGPRSVEEAREIWLDIEEKARSLEDIVSASRAGGREGDVELTGIVRGISVAAGNTEAVLGRCLSEGETMVLDGQSMVAEDDALKSLTRGIFVCTPITSDGQPIGVIVADNMITGQRPTGEQVRLLRALARQVGQVIANATQREEIKRRYQELSTLNEVGKGILSTTDLRADLSLIARISAQVLNARGAVVRLLDEESGDLVVKAMFGIPLGQISSSSMDTGQRIAEKVAVEGVPVVIKDTDIARAGEERPGGHNLLCVPLAREKKVMGTLTVMGKAVSETLGPPEFDKHDMRFLTVLAGQAAIAIENAKMIEGLRNSEERIKDLHRHLLRSERLAALGELSSQVAHEIRNPLTSIGGFARSIERNMSPDHRDRRFLEIIIKETDRLERILTEHLSFAKLSPPDFKEGDLNGVLRETLNLFTEKAASKETRLEVELAERIPPMMMDSDKIKQVFINLLQNALDSIEEGGSIGVFSNRLDRTVEVRVTNDGPPIAPEVLDRLFVPFATTKSSGFGLGLPIACEIVYEHGGSIDVRSEEGKDTVFLVTLPLIVEGDRRTGPIDRRSAVRDRRRLGRKP